MRKTLEILSTIIGSTVLAVAVFVLSTLIFMFLFNYIAPVFNFAQLDFLHALALYALIWMIAGILPKTKQKKEEE